jgi:hypothetical protein
MYIFTGNFNFKGLTARRLYKSFGVKGLNIRENMAVVAYFKVIMFQNFTRRAEWNQKPLVIEILLFSAAVMCLNKEIIHAFQILTSHMEEQFPILGKFTCDL